MSEQSIYASIASRTQGDVYIGVVGPVRTGKSSFIKRFMDVLVLPQMEDGAKKERAVDELPQSGSGRSIMTTEPKFVPEKAVELSFGGAAHCRVRLIDCVGYIVPSAIGYIEEEQPRMVKTPWFEEEIPFHMAAEVGTRKVIREHSTIGLVVTTDGSIGDLPREEYAAAEATVIRELQEIEKPFAVLLNSTHPGEETTLQLARELSETYGVAVMPVNCQTMDEHILSEVMQTLLYEFPIREMQIDLAPWLSKLDVQHPVRSAVFSAIGEAAKSLRRVRDSEPFLQSVLSCDHLTDGKIEDVDLSSGSVTLSLQAAPKLYYQILSEQTGIAVEDEETLLEQMRSLSRTAKEFGRFRAALDEVEQTGYGIVMPTMDELSLEEPEIMKQGGRYGVRLQASAPSIHMMKANITTTVAPIVGTESQSEELILYLLKEFEEDPSKIWESDIFGKSLSSLVNEGLHNKLYKMPADARRKLQETLERVINEGCSGLICIIL